MQEKWNETCPKYETSKHAVKSSSTKIHSSILRLSLRQYVEQRTDITFTLSPVSLTFWNLCSASAIQPHFIQSYLICYLSLCTSATQLMCEPCNVLQSGPRFDFIQPFFLFWNLAAPLPSSSLWTYATPLPSSPFLSFVVSQNCLKLNCKSQIPDSLFCFSL